MVNLPMKMIQIRGNRKQTKNHLDSDLHSSVNPHIIYLIDNFPSPTEYFILNEITELEKKGFKIDVLVLQKQRQYFNIPEIKNLNSQIIFLPRLFFFLPFLAIIRSPFSIFRFPFYFSKDSFFKLPISLLQQFRNNCISLYFFSVFKSRRIGHVHAHFAFIGSEIACLLSKQLGVKFSFTAHAQDIYTNHAYKLKNLVNEASFIITCTKYNREYLQQLAGAKKDSDKIFTVYHGIDISKWTLNGFKKRLISPVVHILSVARLVEKKGLFFLLKAIKLLVEKGMRVRCTIIGEGPLQRQLKGCVREMGLYNYIDLTGFVPQSEVKGHLGNANIFVLSSTVAENGDRDGLPNVIPEAMVMGVPVVSTPVSAIPEIIEDGITGILVKEKDEKALANAISELVNDRKLYNRIAENSKRKILEKFTIEKSTEKLTTIFRNNI